MDSIGYCQGMTLLAVNLYRELNNEEVRICVMLADVLGFIDFV